MSTATRRPKCQQTIRLSSIVFGVAMETLASEKEMAGLGSPFVQYSKEDQVQYDRPRLPEQVVSLLRLFFALVAFWLVLFDQRAAMPPHFVTREMTVQIYLNLLSYGYCRKMSMSLTLSTVFNSSLFSQNCHLLFQRMGTRAPAGARCPNSNQRPAHWRIVPP